MTEKPHAALLRENALLRDVAAKAIRLRAIGMESDRLDGVLNDLWEKNPDMPRSATQQLMVYQAFETAMKDFDDTVAAAVLAGMDWAVEHGGAFTKPKDQPKR